MTKTLPRADHVGSLLRPASIVKARAARIGGADLAAVEDAAIPELIRVQENLGLPVVTDGEARRAFWHYDFMGELDGMELRDANSGLPFKGDTPPAVEPHIVGKVDFSQTHPMIEHFKFVAQHAKATPKISIPGPSVCHYRVPKANIHNPAYADPDQLFADIAAAYKKAVAGFYEAGCRYLQLDDIYFAYLGDPAQREARKALGEDPDELIRRYAFMLNEAIKDRPADMIIGMHMCRGNFRSTHIAAGGYDAAADAIFNQTDVDVYFMEYDTERAGGLEPLRLLPKGDKRIMAGFITTKTPELESLDDLRRQFDAASKFVDLDQLGIAPQCGFASTEHGNAVTEDDQKRKLELVVKTAEAIWGSVN